MKQLCKVLSVTESSLLMSLAVCIVWSVLCCFDPVTPFWMATLFFLLVHIPLLLGIGLLYNFRAGQTGIWKNIFARQKGLLEKLPGAGFGLVYNQWTLSVILALLLDTIGFVLLPSGGSLSGADWTRLCYYAAAYSAITVGVIVCKLISEN